MKKITCVIVILSMLFITMPTTSFAAEPITVSVSVNNATGIVTITGKISSGQGRIVTVKVINPYGSLDYLDQITSGANGQYAFSYKLKTNITGTYTVTVGGTGITSPVSTSFTYPIPEDDGSGDTGDGSEDTGDGDGDTGNGNGDIGNDSEETGDNNGDDGNGGYIPPVQTPVEPGDAGSVKTENDGSLSVKPDLNKDGQAVIGITEEDINKAAESAAINADGIKAITIKVEKVDGAKEYVQGIPVLALNDNSKGMRFIIETEFGTMEVPSNMLTAVEAEGSEAAYLSIRKADKNELSEELKSRIGEKPVVELKLKLDDKEIAWNNYNAPVTVYIPYEPTEEELKAPEHIVVWHIDGAGNVVSIPSGRYDAEMGMATFTTTHFSKYAVAFVKKSFNDIGNYAWARKEIEVMASKGIINGTSATTFTPSADITRADFIVLLVRSLGLEAEVDGNFSDVKADAYYARQVGIARKLGITNGVGNNMFNPNEKIKRQDMMALIDRAMDVAGKNLEDGTPADLAGFADREIIASYAKDSVATLVRSGIIKGDGTNINPLGNTTRAEAAVIMYRIYNKIYS